MRSHHWVCWPSPKRKQPDTFWWRKKKQWVPDKAAKERRHKWKIFQLYEERCYL